MNNELQGLPKIHEDSQLTKSWWKSPLIWLILYRGNTSGIVILEGEGNVLCFVAVETSSLSSTWPKQVCPFMATAKKNVPVPSQSLAKSVSYGWHSLYVMSDLLLTHNWPGQVAGKAAVYWVLLLLAHPAEKDVRRKTFFPPSPGGMLEGKEDFNSK